jgi:para-nitrobenzyl esterase
MRDSFTAFAPTPGEPSMPLPVAEAAAQNPVPLLIGTTRDEMLLFTLADPMYQNMDEAGLARYAAERFGSSAADAVAAYRDARPGATPGALASAILTDEAFRTPARRLAEERARLGHPTYMHWFTWETPQFGGLLRSCHALDIPFVFHNLARNGVEAFTGNGSDREGIADFFSAAATTFARTGNPGWAAYDLDQRHTMQIDVERRLLSDPEPDLRRVWDNAG